MRYFDARALAKRYVSEPDSAAVVERLETPAATSRLAAVEVASAIGLLARYSIRSSDAIHLASCLTLGADIGADIPFVVFDTRLRAAAMAEDLQIEP